MLEIKCIIYFSVTVAEMLDSQCKRRKLVEFGSQFRGSHDGRGSFFMCFEHEEEVRREAGSLGWAVTPA